MGVAVVHRLGLDPGGEDPVADSVHADIAAGNERLELRRAVTEDIETRARWSGPRRRTIERMPLCRLVDHLAVLGVEGAGRERDRW